MLMATRRLKTQNIFCWVLALGLDRRFLRAKFPPY